MLETTRTYRAKIVNHSQVSDDLDACGFSASKLWNVARYHTQQVWDETGEVPSEADLKRELKDHLPEVFPAIAAPVSAMRAANSNGKSMWKSLKVIHSKVILQ